MEELSLSDYFAILRRWKKHFLITTGILFVISFVFTSTWSNYRAIATVQVEPQQISANATTPLGVNPRDAQEAMADQDISQIEQKVLSTSSLIEIITKFDLYSKERAKTPVADIAENMRKKVKVALISGDLANPAAASKVSADQLSAIGFTVSFDYKNPLIAQQVTDELVSRFLDQDLIEKRAEAQSTSDFLSAQITAMETSMAEQESKIADFQKAHGYTRPEDRTFNQQTAATLNLNLQTLDSQITSNEGQLGSLRAQLAGVDPYSRVIADGQMLTTPSIQLKALQGQYASLTAQYGPDYPDVIKVKHQIESLQVQVGGVSTHSSQLKAQIADVRTNLEVARKTYGDDHPDVKALQNQLQNLESQAVSAHTAAPSNKGILSDADNPAYLQIVAEINAADEQHKALLEQRKALQEQQAQYQKAITENPEAAKEMATLSRDYDNAQLRFRELKEKKMAADMDLQMVQDRKGGRLTLINPPELPLHTQPSHFLLLIGAILVSIFGGCASIFVAQLVSQSIVGAHHLESIVGVSPLVSIPHIATGEERYNSMQQRAYRLWGMLTDRAVTRRRKNAHG